MSTTNAQNPIPEASPNPFFERFTASQLRCIGLIALAQLPMLILYGMGLWRLDHYQFFPIVLIGAAVLLVDRTRMLGQLQPGRVYFTLMGISLSLPLFAAMIYLDNSLLALFTAMVTGLSIGYGIGGWKLCRAMIAPTLLLAIVLRPPFGWDRELIGSMQTTVSLLGSHVLDVFGIVHGLDSNVINLPEHKDLFVEEACSGIHSLFSAVSVALFYAFWTRRPWYHTLLLLTITVGWVMAANVARVSVIGIVQVDYNLDLAEGWRHELLGGLLFAGCLLMIWSSDQFLQFVFGAMRVLIAAFRVPDPDRVEAARLQADSSPTVPHDDSTMQSILLMITVLMLGLGTVAAYQAVTHTDGLGITTGPIGEPLPIPDEELPKSLGDWMQVQPMRVTSRDQGGIFGDFSHTWGYTKNGVQAEVSLDYPFPSWKDLAKCYFNAGWILKNRTAHPGSASGSIPYHEVELHKNLEEHGYLLFTQLRGNDEWMPPPTSTLAHLSDVFIRRTREASVGYQMQVFVSYPLPLTDEQKQDVHELFDAACHAHRLELIRQKFVTEN